MRRSFFIVRDSLSRITLALKGEDFVRAEPTSFRETHVNESAGL